MKKNQFRRLLLLAFAVLLAVTTLFACDQAGTSDDTTAAETEPQVKEFELTEDWVLVRSDTSEAAVQAMRYIRDAIKDIYGFEPALKTDFLMKNEQPGKHEILVGATNREVAASFHQGLTVKDYGYHVISDSTIVVSGGDTASIMQGAERFLKDLFGYTGEGTGQKQIINVGASRVVKYAYPVSQLTIGGKPLSDYTIVYSVGTEYEASAKQLATAIANLTGISLPVQKSSAELTTSHKIHVGDGEKKLGEYIYEIVAQSGNLALNASRDGIAGTVESFLSTYLPSNSKGKVNVSVPNGINTGYTFADDEHNGLVYQNTTDVLQICPGVKRYTRHYIDRNGKPVKAYIIEAAPGSVNPVQGTRNAEYTITAGTQSILNQIKADEQKYGSDICAAVNGCFYQWVGPNGNIIEPYGLSVKDGRVLSNILPENYPIFAVMKDGSYFFGYPTADAVNVSNIQESVAGCYMLVKDGEVTDMGLKYIDPSFAKIRHPRTAVGAKEDGTLFLVVVDGRQPSHSNGASLPDLALIFRELDCVDAVNIDGGGSSISYTMNYTATQYGQAGQYTQWNKPSDGSPRSVINCLLLRRNPAYKEN